MLSACTCPMEEKRRVITVANVTIWNCLLSKTSNLCASCARMSENSLTWLITIPIINAVLPLSPVANPSPHMIVGSTKTVSSAMRNDIAAASFSPSGVICKLMPSMKKKRTTPNALIGSTLCSISSLYGTEDRLTPAKNPPISAEKEARPHNPAIPNAYPTVPMNSISPETANSRKSLVKTYFERIARITKSAANFPNIIAISTPREFSEWFSGSKVASTARETTAHTSCKTMRPRII
mmetsp:Transcript_15735/g.31449  ORF Transcript_15735/g.31449 Transcript_15735/m.31449 type:complete len:238 (-) Transcript_15735:589-1302(-)